MVSVIIPTYNRAKLLIEAVQSVLDGTYKNIEIIVIDDGSSDDTKSILNKKYKNKSKVKIISNTRKKGPAGARNTGLLAAKGDYIAFLDSDDLWMPKKLEVQLKGMEKAKSSFSSTFCKYVNYACTRYNIPSGNIFKALLAENYIRTSSVIITKEVVQKIGLFDEEIFGTEDLDYWLRISREYDFYFEKEFLGIYRRFNSIDSTAGQDGRPEEINRFNDKLRIFEKLEKSKPLNQEEKDIILKYKAEHYQSLAYNNRFEDPKTCLRYCLKSLIFKPDLKTITMLLKLPLYKLTAKKGFQDELQ